MIIGLLYYPVLTISILLAIWGIAKKSAKVMYVSAFLCFLCALAGMWSIGIYLVPAALLFLLIGVFFSFQK